MAGLEAHQGILHTIKAWLYPNYFQHVDGKFIARAKAETPLSVENVCASATTRGRANVSYETMVEAVRLYYSEAMYQLADGFSVNNGYYSIHPTIKGAFENAESPMDPEKNKIDFTFQKRKGMRDLFQYITVQLQGLAQTDAFIGDVLDIITQSVDDTLTPGGVIAVNGYKIKVDGPDVDNGFYFIEDASGTRTKMATYFVENRPSRVVVLTPALAAGVYHIEIRTQYSGSVSPLKTPRVVGYAPGLTVPAIVPING
ncbi:MAG: DUF4469 domain-containing protein [Treponema sp.]|jgi:hypothetical protein|nr:DUF4469 domain-containing protein [Treponema sp.]